MSTDQPATRARRGQTRSTRLEQDWGDEPTNARPRWLAPPRNRDATTSFCHSVRWLLLRPDHRSPTRAKRGFLRCGLLRFPSVSPTNNAPSPFPPRARVTIIFKAALQPQQAPTAVRLHLLEIQRARSIRKSGRSGNIDSSSGRDTESQGRCRRWLGWRSVWFDL